MNERELLAQQLKAVIDDKSMHFKMVNGSVHVASLPIVLLQNIVAALSAPAPAKQEQAEAGELVFVCRASGEGSHYFRVCRDEAGVMTFYKEMYGEDYGGGIQSAIDHFRDPDNWSNEGTAYECKLYCAVFEVWKVDVRQLEAAALLTRLSEAQENAMGEEVIEIDENGKVHPAKCGHCGKDLPLPAQSGKEGQSADNPLLSPSTFSHSTKIGKEGK